MRFQVFPLAVALTAVLVLDQPTPAKGGVLEFLADIADVMLGDEDETKYKGRVDKKKTEKQNADNFEYLIEEVPMYRMVSEKVLSIVNGNAGDEIAKGERAYDCLTSSSIGREGGDSKRFLPLQSFYKSLTYVIVYSLFENDEAIDLICFREENRRKRELVDSHRWTQEIIGARPQYPSYNPEDFTQDDIAFMEYYIGSGEWKDRERIGQAIALLNKELDTIRYTSQNLYFATHGTGIVSAIMSTFQLAFNAEGGVAAGGAAALGGELTWVPEAIPAVIGAIFNFLAFYVGTTELRIASAVTKLTKHKEFLDSAEIEAGFKNSQTLVEELVVAGSRIDQLESQVAEMYEMMVAMNKIALNTNEIALNTNEMVAEIKK